MKPPSQQHQSDPDDGELVRRSQSGERGAFDQLVIRYKDMMFTLCYRILGDYDEANDAAQESFIKAYRGLPAFRGDAALSTWLYRIGVNTCRDRMGIRGRMLRFFADDDVERIPSVDRAGAPGPADAYERQELREAVQDAVASLPPELRILVALHDMEGRSVEETAAIAGVPAGTVKSRLSRARHQLRERLKGAI